MKPQNATYPVTPHARQRLAERWPDTLLRPQRFDAIIVPRNAPLVGYDSATGAQFVIVPETPMVAVVLGEVVTSFLTRQSAEAKIALHGYGREDFQQAEESNVACCVGMRRL